MHRKQGIKSIHLGERRVSDMNFSKFVTLPKAFTENNLDEGRIVELSLSPDGRLTLTPVRKLEKAE
jgi:antitoxin component of MazEF toxin-antitoxin module